MRSETIGYYYGPSHTILDRASIHTKREWDSLFSLVHAKQLWFRRDSPICNWLNLRHANLDSGASRIVMWILWNQVLGPLRKSIGTLRNYDGDCKENVKKAIGLISKTATLRVHYAFLYISLLSLHNVNYDVKLNDQILSLLENGNGEAINSTISAWTRARSLLFSSNQNSLLSNRANCDNS